MLDDRLRVVDAITALSSPRTHDKLRVLNTVLEPMFSALHEVKS